MNRRSSPLEIEAALQRIAGAQLGLLTVRQAEAAGVDRFALDRRRDTGALVPVFASVMRVAAVPTTQEQTILAASLAVPKSTVTATSAAVIHQMPTPRVSGDPTVSVALSRSARTVGITTIRQRIELPSYRWFSTRLASPAATLVMLPRFVAPAVVERCLDHVLVHRTTTVTQLVALIDRLPARAVVGRALLMDLLSARSTGIGHRSRLEQRVGGWLKGAGLRGWYRNYPAPVGGGETVEVDFAWPDRKVALEVSPFFTHGSRVAQERDMERRRLLVRNAWRIVEATDSDLETRVAFAGVVHDLIGLLTADGPGFVCAV